MVSGSFQAFDQTYLLDALERLGPSFVGVTQLPSSVSDEQILRLHAAKVRAVRFNLYRGGSEGLESLECLTKRVHELAGWHAELYLDSEDLPDLEPRLAVLPKVVIDHMGMTREGYPALLRLVERGTKVKATGFGRLGFDPKTAIKDICAVDPSALMFGTDLPSTRARRPFRDEDVETVMEAVSEDLWRKILHDNAVAFYRPEESRRR